MPISWYRGKVERDDRVSSDDKKYYPRKGVAPLGWSGSYRDKSDAGRSFGKSYPHKGSATLGMNNYGSAYNFHKKEQRKKKASNFYSRRRFR